MFEPAGTETQQRQSIVDELERLDERKREILAAVCGEIEEKYADLTRACGLLGHVYGRALADGSRECVFCRAGVLVFPELDVLPSSETSASNASGAASAFINSKWSKESLTQLNEALDEGCQKSRRLSARSRVALASGCAVLIATGFLALFQASLPASGAAFVVLGEKR